MNKHLMTVQEKMERVDYLLYCMQSSVCMLMTLNEETRCGMQETVAGAMSTTSTLIDFAQKDVKEAIEELLAERRAEQQAEVCPQGREGGAA